MGYELGLTATVQTTLSALAPIVFTLLLGFVAAWRRYFGPKEASVLNRMVLWFNLLSRFLNGCRVHSKPRIRLEPGPRHSRTGRHEWIFPYERNRP